MHSANLAVIPYRKERKKPPAACKKHLLAGRSRSDTNTQCSGLAQNREGFRSSGAGTVHPWADELLCSGMIL